MPAEVLYAVIDGDPQTGFRLFGPFTEAQAEYCAKVFSSGADELNSWIMPLEKGPMKDDPV